ncbi:hypothetical protein D9M69_632900 [compost metagenome]
MLKVVGDIGLMGGDHFFETGIELDTTGLPTQHQRGRQAQQQHPQAMVEQGSLEHRAGTRIEVFERIRRGLGEITRGRHNLTPKRQWLAAQDAAAR